MTRKTIPKDPKTAGLLSTREAARLVGASREAIRKAALRQQLPIAHTDEKGRFWFQREAVLAWAEKSVRIGKRPPKGGRDRGRAGRIGPDGLDLPLPPRGSRGGPAAGVLPPPFVAELTKQVVTPDLVARYGALAARDLALRDMVLKAQEDRAAADTEKAATERRKAKMERRALERENNIRQLRDRCLRWMEIEQQMPAKDVELVGPPLRFVLDALGDDTLPRPPVPVC